MRLFRQFHNGVLGSWIVRFLFALPPPITTTPPGISLSLLSPGHPGLDSNCNCCWYPPPGIARTISKEGSKDAERFVRGVLHTSGHFSPSEPLKGLFRGLYSCSRYPTPPFPFPTWVHLREG